jgi:hypothetical protein
MRSRRALAITSIVVLSNARGPRDSMDRLFVPRLEHHRLVHPGQ